MRIEADRLRSGSTELGDPASNRLQLLEAWLRSDRTFVWFDATGDGQMIEVVGDIEAATGIGVFVPGVGSELGTFEAVASHARGLVAIAGSMKQEIAVVAWLGYDAPAIGWNIEPLLGGQAEAGAPSLVAFVDGLAAQTPHVPLTVIAHSYGSVLAVRAAASDHLAADRLVIVGSPNVGVDHADKLFVPEPTIVFVGEAPSDPVTAIGEFTDGWRDDWSGLGHGYDPGACHWGATIFEVQDVGPFDAHVTYTSGASGETIVKIITGDVENVDDRCGWLGPALS
jgi:pimeloyl-ACP methyl ester carboxylesterase